MVESSRRRWCHVDHTTRIECSSFELELAMCSYDSYSLSPMRIAHFEHRQTVSLFHSRSALSNEDANDQQQMKELCKLKLKATAEIVTERLFSIAHSYSRT